jgi:hypothetical protein
MRDFALEVYFSKWEFAAKYNLAGSASLLRQWLQINRR